MQSALGLRLAMALVITAVSSIGTGLRADEGAAQRGAQDRRLVVTALGKGDTPVPGLAARDVILREDGLVREVASVTPAGPPTDVVLLVDDSQAIADLTLELRAGLQQFIDQITGDARATAFRVTTFGDRPTRRQEFTANRAALAAAIDRIVARTGGGATFLEAVIETTRDLRARGLEAPVIVAFVAEGGPEFSQVNRRQVTEALAAAHASLFAIVLQDPTGQDLSDAGRERAAVLGDGTTSSGGFSKVVLSRQGIQPAFRTVASALASRYVLTYRRPDTLVAPARVEVAARDRAVRILAPAGGLP